MWKRVLTWPRMKLINEPSTAQRATQLLKEIDLIYGLVSGVMLKFAFDWSSQKERYDKARSWMAVGLAFGSLVFALVLATLMADVAIDAVTNLGSLEAILVVYWMVFVVVLVLVAISLVALARAVRHIRQVLGK
jgi:lysylphosphatidylglycerol synthetase-like protein (DUF2156 family)